MANSAKQASINTLQGASREKYWKEINTEEKVERVRHLLKSLMGKIDRLEREIQNVKRHTHDKDGNAVKIVKLAESYGEEIGLFPGSGLNRNEDEVYI